VVNAKAISIMVYACACHKHEDATKAVATTDPPPASASASVDVDLADGGNTINHGPGTGTGQGFGGNGNHLSGMHRAHIPRVRQGSVAVTGRLPPEVIQRIVRQSYGRFRLCYEDGLRSDPRLAGTVATKFVIGADGSVTSSARESSTTITDSGVVSCITRAFSSLSFPQPEGGTVAVVYPVILQPDD